MKQEKAVITILSYIKNLTKDLQEIYPENEAKKIAEEYCKEKLNYNNLNFIIEKQREIKEEEKKYLDKERKKLIEGKPLQYILKKAYFYGLDFYVNKNVLIPRQETEILVDNIIKEYQEIENLKILDICSGSGCIGIILKKNLKNAEIFSLDISKKAIEIQKKNSKKNNVEIKIKQYDILSEEKFPFKEKFDIIISNPPYVLESEKKEMHKNVLNYEPEIALFVDNKNPLIFYKRISKIAKEISAENSKLYYEINEKFAKEIIEINEENEIINNKIIKDLNNKNRIIVGEIKKIFK